MTDGDGAAASSIDAAAARAAVPRLRRRCTLVAVGIYPVMAGEAALSYLEGRPGWALFWCALLAFFGSVFALGVLNDLRREAIVLASSDDAVRAYLRARLATAASDARKIWAWVGIGVMLLFLGYSDFTRADSGATPGALGNFLLGGYFVVGRLAVRYLQAPNLERELAALGGTPSVLAQDPGLVELARRIGRERGPLQAAVFWREITGESLADAKKALAALRRG